MTYVLPPRRVIQSLAASNIPVTDDEREILDRADERERERKAVVKAERARMLAEHEARGEASSAAYWEARAKPTQILARKIAGYVPHLDLHRLIQDIAKVNREELVAELQQVWQRDEDQRMAGKLVKPLNATRQDELDAGVL